MVSVYQRCHGQMRWSRFLLCTVGATKITRAICHSFCCQIVRVFDEAIFSLCMDFLTTLDSACTSGGWLKLYPTGIGSHALVR